ncbi:MAG TPA: GNAT family N-acetyltransferase [Amycolatopsis sp.]|nr:GNAT family N-acetyltransferase [Amycolatopsis sp.]
MIDRRRTSGAQGEFGHAVPVRPAVGDGSARIPDRCPRGHHLRISGAGSGWSHFYDLPDVTCRVCAALGDTATWCLLDPTRQPAAEAAPERGLTLVRFPPARRAGIGRIELQLNGQTVGEVSLAACGPCRRAVLTGIRVDDVPVNYRRLGYGRVLVAAALARAPAARYRWSTTALRDTVEARAFWAAVGFPGTVGHPTYCSDMTSREPKPFRD